MKINNKLKIAIAKNVDNFNNTRDTQRIKKLKK